MVPTVMANDGSVATSWQCFELKLVWQMAMAENFCQLCIVLAEPESKPQLLTSMGHYSLVI